MKKISFFILMPIILINCGVILDEIKISGRWALYETEYYQYNNHLDVYKTYTGIASSEPDNNHPVNGAFFYDQTASDYFIDFSDNKEFTIYLKDAENSDDDKVLLPANRGNWKVDSLANALVLNVKSQRGGDGNIWLAGFNISCRWPLSDNSKMEIYIKATDVGREHFRIKLKSGWVNVHSMKGKFSLQND